MVRDTQSEFLDNLSISKRGLVKTASSQVPNGRVEALSQQDVEKALRAFDKSPDISKETLSKFRERAKIDLCPKSVAQDFFQEFCASRRELQELSIITAMSLRQTGVFKLAGRDVYEDLDTGDFWKISEDKKHVMRLFNEDDTGVSDKKAGKIKGPGVPDGTGLMKDEPECPYKDKKEDESKEAAAMQDYSVMGSHPGDGGVVKAESFDDAAAEFFGQEGDRTRDELLEEIKKRPGKKISDTEMQYGDYSVKLIKKASSSINIGPSVTMRIKPTKDEQGFEIDIKGSFRSGDSLQDTITQIKKFWNILDVDA